MGNLEAIKGLAARNDAKPADVEIAGMLSEFDLLALIRAETDETGRESGGRVDFKHCPICGHNGCFSYFEGTASWSCFGASNTSGYAGGTALEYVKATRGYSDTEAVKWLRNETGHPYQGKAEAPATERQTGADGLLLPSWLNVQASEPPRRNPVLIDGVLRRGHVLLLAGKGKIGKSWAAIELCVTLATGGGAWLGLPVCGGGACLYIDPELDPKSLDNRFRTVCEAMGADASEADKGISKWPLRGVPGAGMDAILHDLRIRCEFGQFALVVVDSCSCFVEGDENASTDVRRFSAKVLQIAAATGAAVMLVHHFGKGRDGDRSAADRARGSSVWLDFPDAVLTMTEAFPPSGEPSDYLEPNEYGLLLESGGIREFKRMEPRRLIFGYPLHRLDAEGVTDGWKPASGQTAGGKSTAELNRARAEVKASRFERDLLARFYSEGIGAEGVPITDAAKLCGCDTRTLAASLEQSDYLTVKAVSAKKRFVVPIDPPEPDPPTLALE